MSLRSPWRKLWDRIDAAKGLLLAEEVPRYGKFMKALRMAIEEYAQTVDPGIFDQYGQVLDREAED